MTPQTDHVLIVDDDADARRLFETQLKARGFRTTSLADGPSCLAHLERELPSVVILDLDMPGMDGFIVLETIRTRWTQDRLPVVVVSALQDEAAVVSALKSGANDYVVKPAAPQILAARINSCLSMSRLAAERDRSKELLEYQQKLRDLASQVAMAEENERRRIAQGLHDQIGQSLAIAKMKLAEISAGNGEMNPVVVAGIRQSIEQAIKHVRSLTFELGSRVLYDFGLEAALENLVESARQHGLDARLIDDNQPKPLPDWLKVTLLQAVKELLHNVVKHAKAHRVTVSIGRCGDQVEVAVEDNGVGMTADALKSAPGRSGGFGLFSIRERMDYFGGSISIRPGIASGTCVSLSLPVADPQPIARPAGS